MYRLIELRIIEATTETTTMTLIRYEPWTVLNQLHGRINRLFDAELDRDTATSAATADWIPARSVPLLPGYGRESHCLPNLVGNDRQ